MASGLCLAEDGAQAWISTATVPGVQIDWCATVVQANGRVVLIGDGITQRAECFDRTIYLFGFTADGSVDPTFGSFITPGLTTLSGSCFEFLYAGAATLDAEQRIVVAAVREDRVRVAPVVFRLLPNGAVDVSFGPGGSATWLRGGPNEQSDTVKAVAVEPAAPHRIFVAGERGPGRQRLMVFALDAGGAPASWGNVLEADGRRYQSEHFPRTFQTCTAAVDDMAMEPGDGLRVLTRALCTPAANPTLTGTTPVLLRMRRSANESAARHPFRFSAFPPFDSEGYLPETHSALQLALASDPGSGRSWVLATLINPDGASGLPSVGIAALDADGRTDVAVLAGRGYAIYRPSAGFFGGSLAVQSGGRLIVSGQLTGFDEGPAAFRVSTGTGSSDPTFGTKGSGLASYVGPGIVGAIAVDVQRIPGTQDFVLSGPTPNRRMFASRFRGDAAAVFASGFELP